MHQNYKKFNQEQLLYTDTDSIIYTGKTPKTIHIGNELGQFKQEHTNETTTIYGRKTYQIGTTTKISGTTQYNLTQQDFQKGTIQQTRMNTILTTKKPEKIGTFTTINRNLQQQKQTYEQRQQLLEQQKFYSDHNIKDISNVIQYI